MGLKLEEIHTNNEELIEHVDKLYTALQSKG
jgi:hypothetical protein